MITTSDSTSLFSVIVSLSARRRSAHYASAQFLQSSRSPADLSVIDSCSASSPGFHCSLDECFDYIDQSDPWSPVEKPWAAQRRHRFITSNQSAGSSSVLGETRASRRTSVACVLIRLYCQISSCQIHLPLKILPYCDIINHKRYWRQRRAASCSRSTRCTRRV